MPVMTRIADRAASKGRSGWVLGADIGGTTTRIGIGNPWLVIQRQMPSVSLTEILAAMKSLLAESEEKPLRAVIAAAGPVERGRVTMTNLPWTLRALALERSLGIPVFLINDVQAIAEAIPYLQPDELRVVHKGAGSSPEDAAVILAFGTGLGKAIRFGDRSCPSEGGHAQLPATPQELELLGAHRPTYEDVLSGRGLERLYRRLSGSSLPAMQIAKGEDKHARKAKQWFARFAGRCARNFMLECKAGTCYLAGGIAARNPDVFYTREFLTALDSIPWPVSVSIIMNTQAGLLGACSVQGLDGDAQGRS